MSLLVRDGIYWRAGRDVDVWRRYGCFGRRSRRLSPDIAFARLSAARPLAHASRDAERHAARA